MKDRDNEKRHHQQPETGHQNQRQPVRLFRNPQFIIDFSQNTVGNEKVFDIFGIFAQIAAESEFFAHFFQPAVFMAVVRRTAAQPAQNPHYRIAQKCRQNGFPADKRFQERRHNQQRYPGHNHPAAQVRQIMQNNRLYIMLRKQNNRV